MTNETTVFFKEFTSAKGNFRGWISIPISMLIHFSVIGALILFPLISAPVMPKMENRTVHLMALPAPGTPGIRHGGHAGPRREPAGPKNENRLPDQSRMIAPVEIPDEIQDPDIDLVTDTGSDLDVEGGIEGDFLDTWGDGDGTGDGTGFRGTMNVPVSVIRSPKLIKQVKPDYPSLALKARRQAEVLLEAETDIYGKVRQVRIISGDPLLNDAAVKAIRQWIYEPYIINGIPKAVRFTVRISFRLNM